MHSKRSFLGNALAGADTMQAMRLERPGPLGEDEPLAAVTLPRPVPGRGEVLVRVRACGVCHTELDEIEGRTPPPVLPVVPGHEVVGVEAAPLLCAGAVGDRALMADIDYARHLWMEKSIQSVANVTAADIADCLALAADAGIRPEVTVYSLADANRALQELAAGNVRGAKVLDLSDRTR